MINFVCRKCGILAEWLRRKIRNLLGSARAGSNPADVVENFPPPRTSLCRFLLQRKVDPIYVYTYIFTFFLIVLRDP